MRGQLSGEALARGPNGGTSAFNFLTHSNNTYTGMTTAGQCHTRPPLSRFATQCGLHTPDDHHNGGVIALAGADAEDGFTPEHRRDLWNRAAFTLTNDVRAGVDTSLADMAYPYDILPPFAGRLVKFGRGRSRLMDMPTCSATCTSGAGISR